MHTPKTCSKSVKGQEKKEFRKRLPFSFNEHFYVIHLLLWYNCHLGKESHPVLNKQNICLIYDIFLCMFVEN